MKGIVFNLLEEAVGQAFGAHTWEALLETAGLDGAYTSLGSYPDEDMVKLVDAAASALQQSPEDVLRWFGITAIPLLATRYPAFFAPHQCSRAFLLTLNEIIHPEVRKLYPGANVPDFSYKLNTDHDDELVMIYESRRKLCMLAEGFIEGSAVYFGETARIEQHSCMHRGDAHCAIHISFQRRAD